MSVRPDILSIQPTKGRLMNDINSCYCTNYSICTICARGYSTEGMAVYDRDLAQDWAMSRMADAEMGDL
jgi:hypothetical protein